jgi:hypothetical protein
LRADIVSAVAPQTPVLFSALPRLVGTRHGPMAQFLQQLPSAPMGHGFIFSARSKAVEIFSSAALASISSEAWSMLFAFFSSGMLVTSLNPLKNWLRHQTLHLKTLTGY